MLSHCFFADKTFSKILRLKYTLDSFGEYERNSVTYRYFLWVIPLCHLRFHIQPILKQTLANLQTLNHKNLFHTCACNANAQIHISYRQYNLSSDCIKRSLMGLLRHWIVSKKIQDSRKINKTYKLRCSYKFAPTSENVHSFLLFLQDAHLLAHKK